MIFILVSIDQTLFQYLKVDFIWQLQNQQLDYLLSIDLELIKIMATNESSQQVKLKQRHAVHHLLQEAENKNLVEEHWNTPINLQTQIRRKTRTKQEHKSIRFRQNPESMQINLEKQRLRQLVDQTISNQQQLKTLHQNKPIEDKKREEMELTLKFIKNAKLRPLNSNLTFYSIKKQGRSKFLSSNLSFYKKKRNEDQQNIGGIKQGLFSLKEMKRYEQTGVMSKEEIEKSVVYFTENKSQTVRQLLNRMSIQKTKNNKVMLNSTQRQMRNEESGSQSYLSQQQLKQLNRYSKFLPFQKDEQLLYKKISEVDSIWLSKFKQSWQRSKHCRDSRGKYLKKLIVK